MTRKNITLNGTELSMLEQLSRHYGFNHSFMIRYLIRMYFRKTFGENVNLVDENTR